MVEFAIVCMLLLTLVFGIIEFGLVIRDSITLKQAVREGVRAASLSKSSSEVTAVVTASLVGLDTARLSGITVYYRVRTGTGWPTTWVTGTPDAIPASAEVQLKVKGQYSHALVTGGLFGSSPIILRSEMVMRRE